MIDKNTSEHEFFLLYALEEAKKYQGFCAPNPCVGALAVRHGQIIALAAHQKAGTEHAELALLNQLPANLSDVVLYVTLEPCNHWGKTPPCVNAIIEYGIKTVIYAYRDPNKHIPENCSEHILRSNGIDVIYHPLPEIDDFYQAYTYWVTHKLPLITAKWAQSFDAKVGLPNQRVFISNLEANTFTHQERLKSDLILTSASTISVDNPKLTVRLNGEELAKVVGIIDSRLTLTGYELVFEKALIVHVFHDEAIVPNWSKPNVIFHPIGSGLDLLHVAKVLAKLGYHNVWLEAGPTLMANFHRHKLVKTTHVIIAPTIIGDMGLSAFEGHDYFNQGFYLQTHQMGDNILTTFIWQDE